MWGSYVTVQLCNTSLLWTSWFTQVYRMAAAKLPTLIGHAVDFLKPNKNSNMRQLKKSSSSSRKHVGRYRPCCSMLSAGFCGKSPVQQTEEDHCRERPLIVPCVTDTSSWIR